MSLGELDGNLSIISPGSLLFINEEEVDPPSRTGDGAPIVQEHEEFMIRVERLPTRLQ
jgi:hypothetical protein